MANINPFSYGRPIEDMNRFIGREREIEQVYSRLLSAFESSSIVGERRTGKTSLLKALSHEETKAKFGVPPEKYIFIYQDFQYLDVETVPSRFWRRVLKAIRRGVQDHDTVADEIDIALKDETIDNYTLDDIFSLIDEAELYIVLLLDEFENVTRNEHFDTDFFGGLRALAIHHNLALITSSRQDLVELTHSDTVRSSPFFNIFATINLRLFNETDATQLIEQYLADTGVKFSFSELNVLFAVAGYHPYFLQMAGHFLFSAHQQGLDDAARRRYVLEKTRSEATSVFQDYWRNSSSAQQILLAVMALRELERNGGEDSVENLERFYVRAETVVDDLTRRGLVIGNPATSAYHIFSTEFREYIADEIVGDVDDLRAWRNWQKDEETLVGVLPSQLQDKLSQVVKGLNPAYRTTLGNWLLEPSTADAALELVRSFLGRYEHYRETRPKRDAASVMADTEAPVGDTPKGLFAVVNRRLGEKEGAAPADLSLDNAIASQKKQLRDKQIYSLQRRLLEHTGNLNKLQEEAASYGGTSSAPLKLQNDIERQEEIIAELEAELAKLEQGG